ncbi:phosphorylated adapter RNA export protein isoform X1 [Anopheles aquasalis]|uniref:phosphorylated adapter RNA export protein isoform X1 n=1 Tax=Anopheles aquasalis TaxID=42839 RepID=UPI00215AA33B|nr:phosphorylated adapter RNA export protein isoform X1 [Anopheles aquasalis]
MMEHETPKLLSADLEDGELSDSDGDGYTPLPRPELSKPEYQLAAPSHSRQMDVASDDPDDDDDNLGLEKSDSEGSSDESTSNVRLGSLAIAKRMSGHSARTRPPQPKRPSPARPPVNGFAHGPHQKARPNKYNIWTESLQEDTLMETMRGCDVTPHALRSRDVESYDYKLKDRLQSGNAFNRLKRRQSYSDDSDGPAACGGKRMKTGRTHYPHAAAEGRERRVSVKERIGIRNSTDTNSDDSGQSAPRFAFRHIQDLDLEDGCSDQQFAFELADKLCEQHTDLMVRVVEVLGREIPLKMFKETQKIEADGGMLVMKGWRRRTPGGVFLFLLKHCDDVDAELKKQIFTEDKKAKQKDWKLAKAINRDKKVEELKKKLNRQASEAELPAIPMMAHLKAETNSTLSNPPPSPVGEENYDGQQDFEARDIHVNALSPEKIGMLTAETDKEDSDAGIEDHNQPAAGRTDVTADTNVPPNSQRSVQSYQDDCLDITCDDMDMF